MGKEDTQGIKLLCGGKEVTKEQVNAAIRAYEEKMASPQFQEELKEFSDFLEGKPSSPKKAAAWVPKHIEYYQFPNGTVVKSVVGDGVYRFDPSQRVWEEDPSLTAEFAWDRPYGEPCAHLREVADISCDLPPFPAKEEFVPGHTVLIGAYPQKSAYDFSPIPWIVLETDGTCALCIARDCLITSGYCDPQKAYGRPELLLWKNSLARKVCNGHFYKSAFSPQEGARMLAKEAADGKGDPVFLLSQEEAERYFPTPAQRKARPTPYARQKGARLGWTEDTKDFASWWLHPETEGTGAHTILYPKAVFQMGEIQFHGRNAYHSDFTLRPCIRVRYQ